MFAGGRLPLTEVRAGMKARGSREGRGGGKQQQTATSEMSQITQTSRVHFIWCQELVQVFTSHKTLKIIGDSKEARMKQLMGLFKRSVQKRHGLYKNCGCEVKRFEFKACPKGVMTCSVAE